MSFKSLMYLLDPAPPLRRVRGDDYARPRRGYGPRYRRCNAIQGSHAMPPVLHDLPVAPEVGREGLAPGALALAWAA